MMTGQCLIVDGGMCSLAAFEYSLKCDRHVLFVVTGTRRVSTEELRDNIPRNILLRYQE